MKHFLCFILCLILISSCNEKSNENIFFLKLSNIIEKETWLINKNDKAIEKILKIIEDNPQSLNYRLFEWETEEYMWNSLIKITTSDDENVRVYNINTVVPDGNRSFGPDGRWIIQYRIDGIVYTDVWTDKYSLVKNIYTIQGHYKTYYLFVDYSSYVSQGEFMDETITAYSLNHQTHRFQEERLFKTKRGFLSSIDISWIDCDYTSDNLIYSELHHICCYDGVLHIPLITNNGIMTEGYLLYLWDGNCFKFKSIEPIVEFKANDFTVRIEILSDGKYKYSSWGKNKSTCMHPDLVLYNGEMTCWDETGICECNSIYDDGVPTLLGRKYSFKNNEYLYCFEYGWWKGSLREYFTIFKGKEEILSAKAEVCN